MDQFVLENVSQVITSNLFQAVVKETGGEVHSVRSSTLNSTILENNLELFFLNAPSPDKIEDEAFETFWDKKGSLQVSQLQEILSSEKHQTSTDSLAVTIAWTGVDRHSNTTKFCDDENTTVEWTKNCDEVTLVKSRDEEEDRTLPWENVKKLNKEISEHHNVDNEDETLPFISTGKRKSTDTLHQNKRRKSDSA